MYEHGWKRDINYIIAYSRDDVQDVTWRYSSNHNQVFIIHSGKKKNDKSD